MGLYLRNQHLIDVADLLKDPEGNDRKEVDIEGFKLALSHVDSLTKSLPATAQVFAFSSPNWSMLLFHHICHYRCIKPYLFVLRLLLNKVHIFLGASTIWRDAKIILKVLDVLEVLGVTSSVPLSM